jgi:hypothetical protein
MKRDNATALIIAALLLALTFSVAAIVKAHGGEQTRIYGPDGRSLGTATPQSDGTIRYRDSRGNSLGTSTTTGNTTTFYGPGGSVTGKAVGPSSAAPFSGARR